MIRLFFLLLLIFSACSYHKDKLVIKNNSKEDISYAIFIKTKNEVGDDYVYKIVSAPGGFNFFNETSPIVRNDLSDEMDEFSCDSILLKTEVFCGVLGVKSAHFAARPWAATRARRRCYNLLLQIPAMY